MHEWRRDEANILRIENQLEDDRYVVRAKIPGIEPDGDVAITVTERILTISRNAAELPESKREVAHPRGLPWLCRPTGRAVETIDARLSKGERESHGGRSPAAAAGIRLIVVTRRPWSDRAGHRGEGGDRPGRSPDLHQRRSRGDAGSRPGPWLFSLRLVNLADLHNGA
jgi:hypothetical protein